MKYPFTEQEFQTAVCDWGCNCGPAALAFALQRSLDVARAAIPEFDAKRYTSPTMMEKALQRLGVQRRVVRCAAESMVTDGVCLVRVQWTGPWTDAAANPRWAYAHTHWIVTWRARGPVPVAMVFDCNGGVRTFDSWVGAIVPLLTAHTSKRADGGWCPTHIWEVSSGGPQAIASPTPGPP